MDFVTHGWARLLNFTSTVLFINKGYDWQAEVGKPLLEGTLAYVAPPGCLMDT